MYVVKYTFASVNVIQKVSELRIKTFINILETLPSVTSIDVSHYHINVREIGMVGHYGNSKNCGYGCKIVKCDGCGAIFESHRRVYGCNKGQ